MLASQIVKEIPLPIIIVPNAQEVALLFTKVLFAGGNHLSCALMSIQAALVSEAVLYVLFLFKYDFGK